MKRWLFAALLIGGLVGPASARIVWQGDLFVTSATQTCDDNKVGVGSYFRSVFRPHDLPDNGTTTYLALFGPRNAQTYYFANKGLVNGTYPGSAISSYGTPFSFNSTFSKVSTSPANVAATTKSVAIKATIANFYNFAGCTLTLQGTLGLRPQ